MDRDDQTAMLLLGIACPGLALPMALGIFINAHFWLVAGLFALVLLLVATWYILAAGTRLTAVVLKEVSGFFYVLTRAWWRGRWQGWVFTSIVGFAVFQTACARAGEDPRSSLARLALTASLCSIPFFAREWRASFR